MGFEKDVSECLSLIKSKMRIPQVSEHYSSLKEDLCFTNVIINLISATLSKKVQNLSLTLTKDYKTVGFDETNEKDEKGEEDEDSNELMLTIPKAIKQLYSVIPDQFRLLYLLAFLFIKRDTKVFSRM